MPHCFATNGANVTIKNATVNSSAQNGNGIFSYGTGTTVNVSDSTITTTADNSGYSDNRRRYNQCYKPNCKPQAVTLPQQFVRTEAAVQWLLTRGKVILQTVTTPAAYSASDITVSNATLTANNSESLVIEG